MQTTPRFLLPCRFLMVLVVLTCLAPLRLVHSQPNKQGPDYPQPRVLMLTPCGGKAGTTVEVQVSGQDIDAPQGLLFSRPEIKSEFLDVSAEKSDTSGKRRGQQQGMTNTVARFKVTIPANAPTGFVDLRLVNAWGVSNPRTFVISDQNEVLEKEPNNDLDQAQQVEINSTVNGSLSTPTDVDFFVFSGKKGQRVVVSCLATSIDSRAQPALQLYNKRGTLLASNRNYQDDNALLDKVLPEDGEYYVRLFSFTYTVGGPDHFYRLTITTAPWIDAAFPSALNPGKDNQLTIYGRNLPGGKPDPSMVVDGSVLEKLTVTVKAPADPVALQRLDFPGYIAPRSSELDGLTYRLKNASGHSNPFLLHFARAPVVADNGDNDTPEKAQKVSIPCEISGWIERVRDRDWYLFEAKKGDAYSIEVFGDRLGSPLDMYFSIRPADGKSNGTEYDDNPDILHPLQFYTRTDDPQRQRFTAPADGRYLLQVSSRDSDQQAGPRSQYRVRIAPEKPDFRLILMPTSTKNPSGEMVQTGSAQAYTVLVWRQDGYEGPIRLSMEGLPVGVNCPPQTVGAGQRQGALVVVAEKDAKSWNGVVTVKGTAEIDGKTVVREARPATITWPTPANQQNVPALSRLDHSLVLAVRDGAPFRITATPDTIKARAGERPTINLKVERLHADFKGPITLNPLNLPQTLLTFNNNQPLTVAADKNDANGVLDLRNALQPGQYTVVLRAQAQVGFSKDAASKSKTQVNAYSVVFPITLEVQPKTATGGVLMLSPDEVTVQKGSTVDIEIKVNRPADLTGDLKLEVLLNGFEGVTAMGTMIPAGKSTGKITVKVDANSRSGARTLTVRLLGQPAGKSANAEARLTVNVARAKQ